MGNLMATSLEPQVGDHVRCVSGPHEGRSGVLTQLRQVQVGYGEPDWYAVVAYEETNSEDVKYTDHFAVPVRRLKPF